MQASGFKSNISQMITAVMAVLCILLFCLICTLPGTNRYAYAPNSYSVLKPVERIEETIPDYAGKSITYIFTVPDGSLSRQGARLFMPLEHTIAEVWIDGDLRYSTAELPSLHIGKTQGNYWFSIVMRSENAGKTVKLRLTPVYKSLRFKEPQFLYIQHGDLLNLIVLPKDKYFLIASTAVTITGLFLAIVTIFLKIDKHSKRRLFSLSALSFCAGLWKLTTLPFITLFLDIYGLHREIWYLGALAWLMLPMLFNSISAQHSGESWQLFVTENRGTVSAPSLHQQNPDKKIYSITIWSYINAGLLLIVLILQLLNLADIYETMFLYGLLCAIAELFVLYKEKPQRKELVWLITFPAALAADILIYKFSGTSRWSIAVLLWAAFNLIFRAAGFISEAIEREHLLHKREEELREAKVRSMMQQIRPHFIYNTLTSVYVLCREDPEQAMKVIDNFTTYLQANFTAITAEELISFSDELRHTRAYLAVESIRFGEKLAVDYDLKHTAFRLPPLILQPIVENAVKHGVGAGHFPEHILIQTWKANNAAVLTVEDDGPGFDTLQTNDNAHIGLQNVRDRLELMCGGSLDIQSSPQHGTLITVTIPDRENEHPEAISLNRQPDAR